MSQTTIKIPSELFALAESSHFEGTIVIDTLEAGPDDYTFAAPLPWSIDVTNTGSALLVQGVVEGQGTCACSRCLEDVTYEFEGDIEGYFLLEGSDAPEGEDEDDPGTDEFDVLPADHMIDLEPLIRAALIVDAVDQPLCKDDCAGLCPYCGANLNEGDCGCIAPPDPTNPFSALAGLSFD